ncbi:hypothetical protein [Leifsonia sp. NCR5]|uniref:hypothetical protein n=1 Tax=Leifsonia sp. NCR5 TaxID=1978342 RepID=UPI000A1983D3|nr:hypothetical protein [Leifsonia sp. NCR5]
MPLRRQAEEMRDLYANAIAEAIFEGREPTAWQLAAWARYREAAESNTLADALRSDSDTEP